MGTARTSISAIGLGLVLLLWPAGVARPQILLTQRGLNAYAATLARARRALVEESGLRALGEPFRPYLRRVLSPLPQETPAAYQARVTGYIAALTQATENTAALRTLPRLHDASATNRHLWNQITRALRALPEHVARLRAAWRARQPNRAPPAALWQECEHSLNLIQIALDTLRDAAP